MEYVLILWLATNVSDNSFGDRAMNHALTFPSREKCEEAFIRIDAELARMKFNIEMGHACIAQVQS